MLKYNASPSSPPPPPPTKCQGSLQYKTVFFWNSLPLQIRSSNTISVLNSWLKSCLFENNSVETSCSHQSFYAFCSKFNLLSCACLCHLLHSWSCFSVTSWWLFVPFCYRSPGNVSGGWSCLLDLSLYESDKTDIYIPTIKSLARYCCMKNDLHLHFDPVEAFKTHKNKQD